MDHPTPATGRRRHRLAPSVYRDTSNVFSITLCTRPRRAVLVDPPFARFAIRTLGDLRTRFRMPVWAYCLMPDHAHLLIGPSSWISATGLVGAWKSMTARYRGGSNGRRRLWQRSFYDHALRSEEDLRTVALYILHNPVRAGLVDDWREYLYSGSFEIDLG
jgi:REP element-mobilizing transposase RayT